MQGQVRELVARSTKTTAPRVLGGVDEGHQGQGILREGGREGGRERWMGGDVRGKKGGREGGWRRLLSPRRGLGRGGKEGGREGRSAMYLHLAGHPNGGSEVMVVVWKLLLNARRAGIDVGQVVA